jgi:hypothetical protein
MTKTKKKFKLSYYQRNRKKILAQRKKLYAENAEFREYTKKYYAEKYHRDKEYHEKTKTASRNRYHEDEKYRLKTIKRAKKRNKLLSKKK